MCGIIGYIGEQEVMPILISGLKKLEYRGYDSAGIATLYGDTLRVTKSKGKLIALEEKLSKSALKGNMGIGHTRWATHGEPNEINSHPHLSHSGRFAVVHNGIIENYMKIKEFLIAKGYNFVSDTDSEVVSNLIEYNYEGDLLKAFFKTLGEIEGSFALGVICRDNPNEFVATRKESPLIIGLGEDGNFIASDIPAIIEYTRNIYILEDKEVVRLTKDEVRVYDSFGIEVKKEVFKVDWDVASAQKDGYEHFMMKEMMEIPGVIRSCINPRIKDGEITLDNINIDELLMQGKLEKIFILACGTASHAGFVAKEIIQRFVGISVEVEVASEFRYNSAVVNDKTLAIVISQSGETLDTLFALREAKKRGAKTLSIVNVIGSSIARESDNILYTFAGPEISVGSTKAYNAQLTVLYLLALKLGISIGKTSKEFYQKTISQLEACSEIVDTILMQKEAIQKFAALNYNAKNVFFLGRNLDYALSMEGSLKLKELSYIHSEAYAGGEIKHGTIALIEKGTLVVCSITQDTLKEKMISNIREVKARGAKVLAITQRKNQEIAQVADEVFYIPDIEPVIAPIAAIVPMQLLAYYMAAEKGCDIDKPRNLAKSVTVE